MLLLLGKLDYSTVTQDRLLKFLIVVPLTNEHTLSLQLNSKAILQFPPDNKQFSKKIKTVFKA